MESTVEPRDLFRASLILVLARRRPTGTTCPARWRRWGWARGGPQAVRAAPAASCGMKPGLSGVVKDVRGDRVEIVIDAGGEARTYEVAATRAGRRVDVRTGRGLVEVSELTRGGTPVRTARFMSSRVLALVEHPAA